jgi:hypothetical protein
MPLSRKAQFKHLVPLTLLVHKVLIVLHHFFKKIKLSHKISRSARNFSYDAAEQNQEAQHGNGKKTNQWKENAPQYGFCHYYAFFIQRPS